VVDSAEVDLETVFVEAGGKAVPLSSDVTIVSGSKVPQSATAGTAVPVTLDLVLKLGDAVQVRGYKLDAKLTGELRLQQVPGRSLLVYGQLDIPFGSYEIYNQRLSTRDGNLAFFGNPANPSLDLRAFRTTNRNPRAAGDWQVAQCRQCAGKHRIDRGNCQSWPQRQQRLWPGHYRTRHFQVGA